MQKMQRPPMRMARRRRVLQCMIALAVGVPAAAGAEERVVQVRIAQRRVQRADSTIRVSAGDEVELRWSTDEATTIHIHGYDLAAALKPGQETRMRFAANATGRYPISAHGFGVGSSASHRELVLLYLEVHPR